MEWEEINWEKNRWEIPANKGGENRKISFDHIVPLSRQALAILEEQKMLTGRGKFVFPGARGQSRPLSENGVRTALRTMGYDNGTIVPHGFRSMARTLLDEQLGYRIDWIEHQLAHAVKDPLGRAYNRTQHLEGRTGRAHLDRPAHSARPHLRRLPGDGTAAGANPARDGHAAVADVAGVSTSGGTVRLGRFTVGWPRRLRSGGSV